MNKEITRGCNKLKTGAETNKQKTSTQHRPKKTNSLILTLFEGLFDDHPFKTASNFNMELHGTIFSRARSPLAFWI